MGRKALMFLIVITLSNIIFCGYCQTEQSAIAFTDPNLEMVIREAIDKLEVIFMHLTWMGSNS